ncbi:syntaxin-binding protein 4 isoform X3 [Rhineura floridana]|uniref:syntaxin-binding protein 4 isoform X3 n=1 Tax=Rhineura floridana TaxID=261503 RepID=UPI002AC7F42A|nr:syntaxin-binding protein 4 isoform X3 [Rhineura floridana]
METEPSPPGAPSSRRSGSRAPKVSPAPHAQAHVPPVTWTGSFFFLLHARFATIARPRAPRGLFTVGGTELSLYCRLHLVDRSDYGGRGGKEFLGLMERYSSHSNTGSARNSPTQLLAGKPADSLSSGSSSRSPSPQFLHPKDIIANHHGKPPIATSLQAATTNDSVFQIITVSKGTGLGLNIVGGINRNEGPLVYILEVIPGGDCHKDGRLRPGDQLVFINKESLIGITYEEARSLINRTKLRSNSSWEIAFIRHEPAPSQVEIAPPSSSQLPLGGCGLQHTPLVFSPALSPNENIASNVSVLNLTKVGFKKTEQCSAFSANNSSADASAGAVDPTWNNVYGPERRKISLNPTVRIKADKLEMALNYLGIQPTKEQQEILKQQLPKDSEETVSFGDFVQVARNLFCLQLDGAGAQGPSTFNTHEIARLLDSQFVSHDPSERDEMEELRKEKSEALKEIHKLKEELAVSEHMRKQLAEDLETAKQEAKASVEETRALRSRIHLAEAAQKQACGMEMDYEEVIRLLETEIANLKAQLADHCGQNKTLCISPPIAAKGGEKGQRSLQHHDIPTWPTSEDSVQDLRKRVTVLDCQLRKSEMAKKRFEVATEKLLQFIEVVPEVLLDNSTSLTNLSDSKATFSSKTLLERLGRNGRTLPASLATEAKELAKSVHAILEADCLPYGWEEAYTADGIKYFINHVTQTTSWIHPVTNILALSCSEDNEDDGFRELPDPKG